MQKISDIILFSKAVLFIAFKIILIVFRKNGMKMKSSGVELH